MALHPLSPSPPLDTESTLPGNYPTSLSFPPIPNKTLHIANLLSTADSTGTNIYFSPLWDLLEAQHGFKRLKILNNRNQIGCYAIAYYTDIFSAQAAMVKLQGVPFAGCRNGLEISYATAPKITVGTEGPRTHGQDAVPSKSPAPVGLFPWTGVGPHPNRSRIPTLSRPSQAPSPRGPGILGDKEFVPYSKVRLSGSPYIYLEDNNDISGGGGDNEDLVDLGFELQPGFRNEQENELFSDVYAVKAQDDDRERLEAVRIAKEYAEIEKAMADLKLKKEGEQSQNDTEMAIDNRIEEFQLERKKEEGIVARGMAKAAGNESKDGEPKEKGDRITIVVNDQDAPIVGGSPVLVGFNKGSVDEKVQSKEGSTGKEQRQMALMGEDWAGAFES